MDMMWALVIITVVVALIFDVINGFHDAATSIATLVSTRVLSPRAAVLWAAFFNFAAMFVFKPEVAHTIKKIVHINPQDPAFVFVVFSALMGAIIWDLFTWWFGLPTSSSHALIGGLVGAGMAYKGTAVIEWTKVWPTIEFIPLAPLIGMAIGFVMMVAIYWIFRRWSPYNIDRLFKKLQFVSAALYSLGHGGNDAQKTMGVIVALLIAAGKISEDTELSLWNSKTLWIVLSCNLAMGLGTAMGGWSIVKTMGMKIAKLKPAGGFCSSSAGAITLFVATHMGIPVSTTHTITGAIIGVGATNKLSGVKWGVAKNILWAWLLTIPLSAAVAATFFLLIKLIHPGF